MGGVVSAITSTVSSIVRNWGAIKAFLLTCIKVISWVVKWINIGSLAVKLVRSTWGIIANFFSGDGNDEVGSTSVDQHNIDEVLDLAETLERRIS